jgi:hypothetical protein
MLRAQKLLLITVSVVFLFPTYFKAEEKEKIALPVDSTRSFERSTFQADYDRVWQVLSKILADRGFQFEIKDKALGRIETDYIIFSRHPQFSKLNNGVRSLAKTPRLFLRKWLDGRIKLFATVRRLAQRDTEVLLRPDIYGFASTLTDDSGVTGEWRQCTSNGKFEFELFNELATLLKRDGSTNAPEVTEVLGPSPVISHSVSGAEASSNVVLSSVPEAAEILLNDQLVGMTPSRLNIVPGTHKVVFRKKGYKDYQREFVVLKNSDLTITAGLEKD